MLASDQCFHPFHHLHHQLSSQCVLPRSSLGSLELPPTIKLIADGHVQGNAHFEKVVLQEIYIW